MGKLKGAPTKAQRENAFVNNLWYRIMAQIAINNFKWNNLPDGLEDRLIERVLFQNGTACFLRDKKLGFVVLPATPTGDLNVYWEPVRWTVIGHNFTSLEDYENSVFIRNNLFSIPSEQDVRYFASKISNVQRTIDTNVELHKLPFLVTTTDKEVLSMRNILEKKSDNELAIFVNRAIDLSQLQVFPTSTPYVIDKLEAYRKELFSQFLTLYSFASVETQKRERLTDDEVNSNNELTEFGYVGTMLQTRRTACDQINERFGLNVSVEIKREKGKPWFMYETESEDDDDNPGKQQGTEKEVE